MILAGLGLGHWEQRVSPANGGREETRFRSSLPRQKKVGESPAEHAD